MSEAFSPLFLCSYLVWLSEARPRQCSSVPVQHAVSQRLQVTASGWSWNGIKQTTVNRLHQLWTLRINVTVSVCKLFLYKKKKLSVRLLCKDAVTMVTSKRFHNFRFDICACFFLGQLPDFRTLMTHLLLYACPGWWTLWRPRVASCCVHGILHVFRLDRTWKRGSIQPEIPIHAHQTHSFQWKKTGF